jgi:acylphosphatase
MQRRTCHFTGDVQGVGFRYTAHHLAMQYDVRGYVRNLPDGRVEVVTEGPDDQMDKLLAGLQERMGAYIRDTEVRASPATGEFSGFSIRH